MGERSVRIREVKGSNPSRSTMQEEICKKISSFLFLYCVSKRCEVRLSVSPDFTPEKFKNYIKGGIEVNFNASFDNNQPKSNGVCLI
jgi:hypothetical protein